MQSRSGLRYKWRRFLHRHGIHLFLAFLVCLALALVAGLMYVLGSSLFRPPW
jgi:hypothetical protein